MDWRIVLAFFGALYFTYAQHYVTYGKGKEEFKKLAEAKGRPEIVTAAPLWFRSWLTVTFLTAVCGFVYWLMGRNPPDWLLLHRIFGFVIGLAISAFYFMAKAALLEIRLKKGNKQWK